MDKLKIGQNNTSSKNIKDLIIREDVVLCNSLFDFEGLSVEPIETEISKNPLTMIKKRVWGGHACHALNEFLRK